MDKQAIVQDDILRYKKNKKAANFALLGLVFNCLYFMLLYSFISKNFKDNFYTPILGGSVILTLVTLLSAFLASEGVKGYNKKYGILLIVLAAVQIIRIFIVPLLGLTSDSLTGHYFGITLASGASFALLVIYLCASAACYVAAAVFNYIIAGRLEKHQKAVDSGEIDLKETFKELDAEDAATSAPVEANSAEVTEVK